MAEPSAHTRRLLERIAEAALLRAGVAGILPTPLEEVQRAAGITARHPIAALPSELTSAERPLLGALWFEQRAVYVDLDQPEPRRRFTDAHEAMHALCPWHEAVLREDTEDELFRDARTTIEAEANLGAGLLIFQGERFARRMRGERCSIAAALAVAGEYGASRQATLHHWVAHQREPTALLVCGRFPRRDGSLPVWRGVESPGFRRRFGPARDHAPAGLAPGSELHALAEAARTTSDVPAATVALADAHGAARTCSAEAYYNRHTFLVLLAARDGRRRVGARARRPG